MGAPTPASFTVRGWCPSSYRPMETGDGLLLRLPARVGGFRADDMAAIADIAERYGNGLIDMTRRANIQLRGVTAESLEHAQRDLRDAGLIPADASAVTPSIMVGPLTGCGAGDLLDADTLHERLLVALSGAPELHALPAKFSFNIDGGGEVAALDGERADIHLRAVVGTSGASVAVGLDTPGAIAWFGPAEIDAAPAVAVALAAGFLAHRQHDQRRMRDLPATSIAKLADACGLTPLVLPLRSISRPQLGVMSDGRGRVIAAGVAAPFGRLSAAMLRRLASCATEAGVASLRVSPWRSLFGKVAHPAAGARFVAGATEAGFICDGNDPLLAIDACPGAPQCSSATVDTHAVARAVADHMAVLGLRSCHVSGCVKGCARSAAADLTLVGNAGALSVVRAGTARDMPITVIHLDELPAFCQRPVHA
ncbi:precorrin-3B synthase [Hyphomicrobium sulfonivorans]|uniref:precorrin-3B synthase n=1 Tax=Hyphomicrobium sulfonivorans TaxID=121290 RepID=UPI0023EE28E3|nr:precorrin-3B synthase [Hyphomicrobium sulfonivorans]NSL72707.1 precorrin-3B synthase [Hyphomicrobium sulfonivorans]